MKPKARYRFVRVGRLVPRLALAVAEAAVILKGKRCQRCGNTYTSAEHAEHAREHPSGLTGPRATRKHRREA